MTAKEQIGRLESLLERVRSRARHANADASATATKARPSPIAQAKAESPSQSDLAVIVTSPSQAPAAPIAPAAPRRPSAAPPLPPPAAGHAAHVGHVAPPPSSAVPSTMELGADDMIESASPQHTAAARAPSEIPPSHGPASASEGIDVDVTEDEVEQPAPSSARRPKSERAHALHANETSDASEEPRRPQTMPPESGRQVAASASPSVPAESGKRASIPAAAFDAQAEAAQHQVASGRAKSTNPAAFIGSPRRAPSTFGEMLDDALSF